MFGCKTHFWLTWFNPFSGTIFLDCAIFVGIFSILIIPLILSAADFQCRRGLILHSCTSLCGHGYIYIYILHPWQFRLLYFAWPTLLLFSRNSLVASIIIT